MDMDVITALLESAVRRLDENTAALRQEVKEIRCELHDIKSKLQLGKGAALGIIFAAGCALFGFKTMIFKWLGWA